MQDAMTQRGVIQRVGKVTVVIQSVNERTRVERWNA